jgi:hypothetical protein
VDRLGHGRNVQARLEASDAAAENGSGILARQNVSLDQALEKRERRHAAGDCYSLCAATEKI